MNRFKNISQAVVFAAVFSCSCGDGSSDGTDYRIAAEKLEDPRTVVPCRDRAPLRRALFGDLHVHTGLSSDAWNYDVRVRPDDAYRYAFGESIWLPPNDRKGRGMREVRIDRPLDFAAVTDHAEFLGEQWLCGDPNSAVYDSETCMSMRESTTPIDSPLVLEMFSPWPSRNAEVCGEDGQRCVRAQRTAWDEIIAAAEQWNDGSPECERTALIGFEYSSLRMGSNLHRNVIFRNHIVPSRPISYMEVQREWDLWQLLREVCIESGTGCDALSIPHNSNISNGRMFAIDYPGARSAAEQADRAALRAQLEPVVEIMQHKGDSECRVDMPGILASADEYCAFEKFENMRHRDSEGAPSAPGECWDFAADMIPKLGPGACMNYRNYVRYVLTEGLAEQTRLGINPFKLGLIASTDTHNAMAGGVSERNWPGHLGVADWDVRERLVETSGEMRSVAYNPGGLVGVWAEENSRESIFDAIKRREVFGTSGPRIRPRFFGAWELPEDLCERRDRLALADRYGVPMGSDLPPRSGHVDPVFASLVMADPGTPDSPGGDLQKIQIIKGWVDDEGALHQRVFDVAGGENGASVDPETCAVKGSGARELCAVWRDPEFDPERGAVYYVRVLENPSCRYSAFDCMGLAKSERPPACAHRVMPGIQQERAWTSPIWYTPDSVRSKAGLSGVQ